MEGLSPTVQTVIAVAAVVVVFVALFLFGSYSSQRQKQRQAEDLEQTAQQRKAFLESHDEKQILM